MAFFMVLCVSSNLCDAILTRLAPSRFGITRLYAHALPDYAYLDLPIDTDQVPNARDFASRMFTLSNSAWLDDASFASVICELAIIVSQHVNVATHPAMQH